MCRPTSVAVTPNGRTITVGDADGMISIIDLDAGATTGTIQAHKGPVWDLAISPDGRRLVSVSEDNWLKVWNLAECIPAYRPWASGSAGGLLGGWGLSNSPTDGWHPQGVTPLATLLADGSLVACAVGPDGVTIAGGGASRRVHFLRLEGVTPQAYEAPAGLMDRGAALHRAEEARERPPARARTAAARSSNRAARPIAGRSPSLLRPSQDVKQKSERVKQELKRSSDTACPSTRPSRTATLPTRRPPGTFGHVSPPEPPPMPKLKGLARILAAAAKDAAATGDWDKAIEILREIQTGVRGDDRDAIDKVLAYNVAMRDGSGRGR